jgi:hypothetical protein
MIHYVCISLTQILGPFDVFLFLLRTLIIILALTRYCLLPYLLFYFIRLLYFFIISVDSALEVTN